MDFQIVVFIYYLKFIKINKVVHSVRLKEIKTFCSTQPGDFNFLKRRVSTELLTLSLTLFELCKKNYRGGGVKLTPPPAGIGLSYNTKLSYGDFWNKSSFRIGNELGHIVARFLV